MSRRKLVIDFQQFVVEALRPSAEAYLASDWRAEKVKPTKRFDMLGSHLAVKTMTALVEAAKKRETFKTDFTDYADACLNATRALRSVIADTLRANNLSSRATRELAMWLTHIDKFRGVSIVDSIASLEPNTQIGESA